MKQRLIFGTWIGYYLLVAWSVVVFGIQNYFFGHGSVSERIVSLIIAWIIFLLGLRYYSWIEKQIPFLRLKDKDDRAMQNIFDGFMNQKNTKIHHPAGLNGVEESPIKYSVGEEIKNEEIFQTIKLLPKGVYDGRDELGEAVIYYNQADVRQKPGNYAEGVQDTFGLLEALEAGRVAVRSKATEEFYPEVKKGVYQDDFEERDRYFFPDGTCFFDIKTMSFTPRFRH